MITASIPAEQRLADTVEAAAFRDMFAAAPSPLAAHLGLRTCEIGGATLLLAPGIPQAFFNRVIGLGVHSPAGEAELDAVIDVFRKAGSKDWWIHLGPGAQPPLLQDWLEARGFVAPARRIWAKMLRGTEPVPEFDCSLEIRPAKPAEFAGVAAAVCAAFGMPPPFAAWFEALARRECWRAYAAMDGTSVVGGGFLYLDDACAWLGAGGVLPDYRGRNAHRVLMAMRIRDAIAAGCHHIVTETGEPIGDEANPSLTNMQRCGFRQVASRLNFAAPIVA